MSEWESYAQRRTRRERERVRREINWSFLVFGTVTTIGIAMVAAGFALAPQGGGWFALALFCWIAGGVNALLFGGFLVGALLDLIKWYRS